MDDLYCKKQKQTEQCITKGGLFTVGIKRQCKKGGHGRGEKKNNGQSKLATTCLPLEA